MENLNNYTVEAFENFVYEAENSEDVNELIENILKAEYNSPSLIEEIFGYMQRGEAPMDMLLELVKHENFESAWLFTQNFETVYDDDEKFEMFSHEALVDSKFTIEDVLIAINSNGRNLESWLTATVALQAYGQDEFVIEPVPTEVIGYAAEDLEEITETVLEENMAIDKVLKAYELRKQGIPLTLLVNLV